jgi:hypothetical protein
MIIGLESGVHNADLQKSATRILEGGSWKKQRVVMVIPAAKSINTKVYLSHCSLAFPPNQGSFKMAAIGMEVGEAFSNAFNEILSHPELSQWEYILTIEHDNIPQYDSLLKLIEAMEKCPEYSCIGGLYWTKGEGGVPQIWGDPKDVQLNFRPQIPDPNGGLVECNGTGMGFNLWRMSMFKDERLRKPFFKTLTGIEGEGIGTQDLYFWGDAKKYGYRCAVHCGCPIGHLDLQTEIVW